MILDKVNKGYITNSMYPNSDWTNGNNYVIEDDSELAHKIKEHYPNFKIVTNEKDEVVDILPIRESDEGYVKPFVFPEQKDEIGELKSQILKQQEVIDALLISQLGGGSNV